MTHRNTAGKMAVRLNIIRADQEPEQMLEHNGAPWPNNYFTLVWTDTDQVCLYVHDEVTKGGVLLACSNQASPDFCITGITLSEDNVLTIQQEGDCPDQSIDLSRFIQSLAEYTVVEGPPGFFTFRKDGVAIESWWQGGFSVVNEDGSITITNPAGSTVTVPAPLDPQSISLTYNSDFSVCLTVGGMNLGCWQQGDIISEDTVLGVHIATKPDGSQITWLGTDHITVASIDAAARTLTIKNPDGGLITIPYGDEMPDVPVISISQETGITTITLDGAEYIIRQTRVSRGTGTRENIQTLTANHQTTWPNTIWRETWMERNGTIVTIHSWNPVTNVWDAVAIEAPENLVILNNPVIYIDADNGQANPPINTQADLTLANAFNSFGAVRTFMNRTLLVGNVTLDCRGDFSLPGRAGMGEISSPSFKNAAQINIRGNPTDPTVFKVPCGGTGGRATAMSSVGGGTIALRDVTLVSLNEALAAVDGAGYFFNVSGASEIRINGTIRFEGFYDTARVGASGSSVFRMAGGGSTYVSYDTVFQFDFDAGTRLADLFSIGTGGTLTIHSNVEAQIARDIVLTGYMFFAQAGSNVLMAGSPGREIPWHYSGLGKFITNYSIDIRDLGVVNLSPVMYGARPVSQLHDFGAVIAPGGAQSVTRIAAVGVLNNIAGP